MDDNASSNDIYAGTGAYFPQVGRQLNASSPIFADVDVADITKMKFTFAPFSRERRRWDSNRPRSRFSRSGGTAVTVCECNMDRREAPGKRR